MHKAQRWGLLVLSILSGGALAADPVTPVPHWSGLPIWGVEAEALGYQVPRPFGIGATAYAAKQPVDILDLQLARTGNPPVSITNFLQIDQVDTSQENVSVKFDVLVFPFLDVYAILGATRGTTKGLIQVPGDPVLGIIEPRQLQLDAAFKGPTYGAGFTLQGGFRVSEWRDLTAIMVADWNRTRTRLEFENDALIAETKPEATVFSARLGMHGIWPSIGGAMWIGAMHQRIQQTVSGSIADTNLQFIVNQSPAKPWNTLLGGLVDFGRNGYVLIEGGVGARKSILIAGVYRF